MKRFLIMTIGVMIASCSTDDSISSVNNIQVDDRGVGNKIQVIVTSPSFKSLENTTLLVNGDAFSACGGAALEEITSVEVISDFSESDVMLLEYYQHGQLLKQEILVGSNETKQGSYTHRHCFKDGQTVTTTNGKLLKNEQGDVTFFL